MLSANFKPKRTAAASRGSVSLRQHGFLVLQPFNGLHLLVLPFCKYTKIYRCFQIFWVNLVNFGYGVTEGDALFKKSKRVSDQFVINDVHLRHDFVLVGLQRSRNSFVISCTLHFCASSRFRLSRRHFAVYHDDSEEAKTLRKFFSSSVLA